MSTADATAQDALQRNVACATEYFAALNARDLDRATACWVATGGVEAVPGSRDLQAPEGVRAFFKELFEAFATWSLQVIQTTAQDDRVVVHWRLHAGFTGPGTFDGFQPTQGEGTIRGLDQLTFADGLIARNDAYFDGMELGRAIGLMPPAGSGPDRAMTAMVNAQTRAKGLLKR